ncbi:hypothetical protein BD408DRAFT_448869 [Parasitella parasitica]|nr:hypothetical protein BD408DRAFT_448869 [Parasitella parasitica]
MSDNIRIYYEDGINAPVDEHGNEAVDMDEKKVKNKKYEPKTEYNSYSDKDKARFFILIYDHGMNPNQAWKAHGHISRTTAYRWYAEDQRKVNKEIEDDEEPSVKRAEKGTRAEVPVPQTRAKNTTILGATSVWGVLNVQVRLPGTSNKKKKLAGTSSEKATTTVGTVTGHYFNFVAKTMDIMDQHEQFKDFYLIMDNAPIYTAKDIEKYIIPRGYRYTSHHTVLSLILLSNSGMWSRVSSRGRGS